jgi:3-isopropylmalate/(R)-2-methylmalate dehydratase small subunit
MGRAWKYGDDVNTDEIIPARYLNTSDPAELAKHCMEDGDKGAFVREHAAGDVIVAGKNFGCGSSREHAPIAIKEAGVSAVIAESFARIFFRNCINIGLPILESPEAAGAIAAGDEVAFDLSKGEITSGGKTYTAEPYPEELREIVAAGGLLPYVKAKRAAGG